jgi:SET family sugar efflux transporter-like MFS transporter
MNTRRVGAIVSGLIIGLGSTTALGKRGIFLACGLLIVLALIVIATAARQRNRARQPTCRFCRQEHA